MGCGNPETLQNRSRRAQDHQGQLLPGKGVTARVLPTEGRLVFYRVHRVVTALANPKSGDIAIIPSSATQTQGPRSSPWPSRWPSRRPLSTRPLKSGLLLHDRRTDDDEEDDSVGHLNETSCQDVSWPCSTVLSVALQPLVRCREACSYSQPCCRQDCLPCFARARGCRTCFLGPT